MVKIVWILNKQGNTGLGGGLGNVACGFLQNDPSPGLVEKEANMEILQKWCQDNNFIEHPTTLCEAIGLNIKCFAIPHSFAKEHKGKNNIAATYLTCLKENGLARNTILGKALLIRYDKNWENPIDWDKSDLTRVLFFINDFMDSFPILENGRNESGISRNDLYRAAKACLPFYQLGDTYRNTGFQGQNERFMDGLTLEKNF